MKAKKMKVWVVLLGMLSMNVAPLSEAYAAGGSGTTVDPYIINTCIELQNMKNNLSASYMLGNDIDCTDSVNWDSGKGFIPVGDATNKFSGAFNGNGYKISNLTIKRPTESYVGLFGYVEGTNVVVQNVTLENATISGGIAYIGTLMGFGYTGVKIENIKVTGIISGAGDYAGGLIGYFRGTSIKYVQIQTTVKADETVGGIAGSLSGGTGAVLSNSFYEGNIEGTDNLGGLVGYMLSSATITQSYSKGSVKGLTSSGTGQIGGLVGYTKASTIQDSFSMTNVNCLSTCATSVGSVGGLLGKIDSGTVQNTFSTGSVSAPSAVTTKGGFLGNYIGGTITNSYWDTTTSGMATSPKGTGKTTAQLKTQTTFTGWDFTAIWVLKSTLNSGYPLLKSTPKPKGWEVTNNAETHTANSVTLSWKNPVDTEFDRVNIYRNGVKITSVTTESYTDAALTSETSYAYKVTTVDTRGNESSGINMTAKTLDITPPDSVGNLTATESGKNVALSWTNPAQLDFEKVRLKRNGVIIYEGNEQTFEDSTVSEKTNYSYEIVVFDYEGNASNVVSTSITTSDKTGPSVVTNVSLHEENTGVKLTWNKPSDDDYEKVKITRNGTLVYEGNNETFEDTSVAEKTNYSYEIVAFDNVGNPSNSVTASILTRDKTAPGNVTMVEAKEQNGITISWTNPIDDDLAAIKIYRNGTLIYQGLNESFIDTEIQEKTNYSYEIVAFDQTGNASNSITVSITTLDKTAPAVVTSLNAIEKEREILLTWTNPSDNDVKEIKIYRNEMLIFQGMKTEFIDTNIEEKTTYVYKIEAIDESGNISSPISKTIVTLDKTAPGNVKQISVAEKDKKVFLAWNNPSDSDFKENKIYRNGIVIYQGKTTNFIDTNVKEGKVYTYKISTLDTANNESTGITVTFKTSVRPTIESVQELSLKETNEGMLLQWKNPIDDRFSTVLIYRNGTLLTKTNQETYLDQTIQPETSYEYKLIVKDVNGTESKEVKKTITTKTKEMELIPNEPKEPEKVMAAPIEKETKVMPITIKKMVATIQEKAIPVVTLPVETKVKEDELKEVYQSIKITKKENGYLIIWKKTKNVQKIRIYLGDEFIAETSDETFLHQTKDIKKGVSYRVILVSAEGNKIGKNITVTQHVEKKKESKTNTKEKNNEEPWFFVGLSLVILISGSLWFLWFKK